METAKIMDMIGSLPEEKQAEVLDFIRFLKYQSAKERILASDGEERISFQDLDSLMDAIEHAD